MPFVDLPVGKGGHSGYIRRVDLHFDLEQLALLRRCQGRSEALVARHYRIPAMPSVLYPYEVATLRDVGAHERAPTALAHLVVYERQRSCGLEQHYRICLQDDVILRKIRPREADASSPGLMSYVSPGLISSAPGLMSSGLMSSVLIYILVHELVHVVRFQRAEQSVAAKADLRRKEELLVHHTTLDLMREADLPWLDEVSSLAS